MEAKLRFFKYLELWSLLILVSIFSLYLKYGFKLTHLQHWEYLGSTLILALGVVLYTLLLRYFLKLSWGQAASTAFGINGVSFVCTTLPLLLFNLYADQLIPSYSNYSWLVSLLACIGYYIFSFFVILKVYPAVNALLGQKFSFASKFKVLQSKVIFKLLIIWAVVVRTLFYAISFYQAAFIKQIFVTSKLNIILSLVLLFLGSLQMFIIPATVLMFFVRFWSTNLKYLKAWLIAFKLLILTVACVVSTIIFLPMILLQDLAKWPKFTILDLKSNLDLTGVTVLAVTLLLLTIGGYLFNIFIIKYGYPEIDSRKATKYLPMAFISMFLVVYGFDTIRRNYLQPIIYQNLLPYDLGVNL